MLNISNQSISDNIDLKKFKTFKLIRKSRVHNVTVVLVGIFLLGILLAMFLPWTQNINAKGYVTARLPEQRPQAIQSVITGRLEKWYVQEGQYIKKGDTIIFLSEVKSDYFDPQLIVRTTEQLEAKSQSVVSYEQKVIALKDQYNALAAALSLKRAQTKNKIQQAYNKVSIDSIDLSAIQFNLDIAKNQFSRTQDLYDKGLKTLSALQEKKLKLQATNAKYSVQKNKFLNQKNNLSNLTIQLLLIEKEYTNKMAKSQSDIQTALSAKFESISATSKLKNKLSNYNERQKLYYVTAPQSGYLNKTLKKGIGETIKGGTDIVTITPRNYDLAVEIYLRPRDLPLLNINNKVQIRFDGWPAIVISGWPESSTGIFTGKIIAIEQFISENGYYRVLLSPDKTIKEWPKKLRMGTGADVFIFLKNVPIWYEIWRKLNGFPLDYYDKDDKIKKETKRKAPIKSIK